jgi:hypothetical protein
MLTPLTKDQPAPDHVAFQLSFDKARRRTPHNRLDFARQIVRLVDDTWSAEQADRSARGWASAMTALFMSATAIRLST